MARLHNCSDDHCWSTDRPRVPAEHAAHLLPNIRVCIAGPGPPAARPMPLAVIVNEVARKSRCASSSSPWLPRSQLSAHVVNPLASALNKSGFSLSDPDWDVDLSGPAGSRRLIPSLIKNGRGKRLGKRLPSPEPVRQTPPLTLGTLSAVGRYLAHFTPFLFLSPL